MNWQPKEIITKTIVSKPKFDCMIFGIWEDGEYFIGKLMEDGRLHCCYVANNDDWDAKTDWYDWEACRDQLQCWQYFPVADENE